MGGILRAVHGVAERNIRKGGEHAAVHQPAGVQMMLLRDQPHPQRMPAAVKVQRTDALQERTGPVQRDETVRNHVPATRVKFLAVTSAVATSSRLPPPSENTSTELVVTVRPEPTRQAIATSRLPSAGLTIFIV